MPKRTIIFLVGPTATGKSETAVYLAKKINAEIISCDSMQVYKGMDTITSQPAQSLRKKVRHHLIGVIAPTKDYNAARYRREALKKMKEIINRGKAPLFVGGTGLYASVLIDGIFQAEAADVNIRKRLYDEAGRAGSIYLYKRLQAVDPEAASKIHPHDTRRIIRALEVFLVAGRRISQLQKERKGLADEYRVRIFCLTMGRSRLYRRIEKRADKMFRRGIIREAKQLLKLDLSSTASCAIGIKELKGYFSGLYDLREARRLIKQKTRNYAKRQLTWFRKDKRIEWMELKAGETAAAVANRIFRKIKAKQDSYV
ncbi:MAG: tRNA (adenosine(37)-N6)-dimethylallyltransferase MiaA [Candidatus Omnitrophota bacterium]|jgi:tRNA dimethylallyltransferase